jgi:hypothetical protein
MWECPKSIARDTVQQKRRCDRTAYSLQVKYVNRSKKEAES